MRKHFVDLSGRIAGTYTIVKLVTKAGAKGHRFLCRCNICGREKVRYGGSLIRKGKVITKGCRCCSRVKGEFHGWEKERSIWKDMVERCHKKTDQGYKYYGARGIKVCERWKKDFWAFTKDIGKIPA